MVLSAPVAVFLWAAASNASDVSRTATTCAGCAPRPGRPHTVWLAPVDRAEAGLDVADWGDGGRDGGTEQVEHVTGAGAARTAPRHGQALKGQRLSTVVSRRAGRKGP